MIGALRHDGPAIRNREPRTLRDLATADVLGLRAGVEREFGMGCGGGTGTGPVTRHFQVAGVVYDVVWYGSERVVLRRPTPHASMAVSLRDAAFAGRFNRGHTRVTDEELDAPLRRFTGSEGYRG